MQSRCARRRRALTVALDFYNKSKGLIKVYFYGHASDGEKMGEREMGRPDDRSIGPLAGGPCHAYRHGGTIRSRLMGTTSSPRHWRRNCLPDRPTSIVHSIHTELWSHLRIWGAPTINLGWYWESFTLRPLYRHSSVMACRNDRLSGQDSKHWSPNTGRARAREAGVASRRQTGSREQREQGSLLILCHKCVL
jgi:hypothetical protein